MTMAFMKNAKGVTLVELMIALALSSFLAIGVIQIYLDSRKTDDMGGALARIQETGRVALDIIVKDLRAMGHIGCLDPKNSAATDLIVAAKYSPLVDGDISKSGLRGYEVATGWADGTEFNDTDIESDAIPGSDVIAIQRVMSRGVRAVMGEGSNSMIKLESNDLGIEKDDLVLVANCSQGHMWRISNVSNDGAQVLLEHNDSANFAAENNYDYSFDKEKGKGSSAFVMKFMSLAYFVADTGRKNSAGDAVFALYRQRDNLLNDAASSFTVEEVLEGVDTLQILYGERLADDSIRFVPADTTDIDMLSVESVRIGVLVSSTRNVQQAQDMQSYLLPGGEVSPAPSEGLTHPVDRRVRRAFATTVYLRNRPIRPDSN